MDYIEVTITLEPLRPWNDILVAELADLGFESFIEIENGLQAFAPVTVGNVETLLKDTSLTDAPNLNYQVSAKIIPHQNWNAVWEADFQPVEVDDRLVILAPFHEASNFSQPLKIWIQPQMSFGTGHHQTTFLMSQAILDLPQIPANVLDMGTGTGVLAFLAEKQGAEHIVAIDIEPWSVENTIENAARNNCTKVTALTGDQEVIPDEKYGLILANINKNVLKSHLGTYSKHLESNGLLYLSGFFETDTKELIACAEEVGLTWTATTTKETWAVLKFIKA